ncbi:hypothetical protein QR680_003792 [Steinernema hermaphroditum]|uniref:Uncharacterized protein n=1 Tax=Steinernema hermaphroditum TaxID=289476 RepID=A0AA39HML4_9BILA|nr:hypothetical protein QR680_003792 [Steinernema hermaphroditum]
MSAVVQQRFLDEFQSLPFPEKIEASWAYAIFIVACLFTFWMLYMTAHVYEVHLRTNDAYAEYFEAEYDREDSSYGSRVDDFYANALEDLYDHFGI